MTSKTINKTDFIDIFSKELSLSKVKASEYIDGFFDILANQLKSGSKIVFTGLISFEPVVKAARTGINPQTKEKIKIPAKSSVKVKLGKTFVENSTTKKK